MTDSTSTGSFNPIPITNPFSDAVFNIPKFDSVLCLKELMGPIIVEMLNIFAPVLEAIATNLRLGFNDIHIELKPEVSPKICEYVKANPYDIRLLKLLFMINDAIQTVNPTYQLSSRFEIIRDLHQEVYVLVISWILSN